MAGRCPQRLAHNSMGKGNQRPGRSRPPAMGEDSSKERNSSCSPRTVLLLLHLATGATQGPLGRSAVRCSEGECWVDSWGQTVPRATTADLSRSENERVGRLFAAQSAVGAQSNS